MNCRCSARCQNSRSPLPNANAAPQGIGAFFGAATECIPLPPPPLNGPNPPPGPRPTVDPPTPAIATPAAAAGARQPDIGATPDSDPSDAEEEEAEDEDDAAPLLLTQPPAPEADAQPPPPEYILPPDEGADLPGYALTEADLRLDSVYGDHTHDNPGIHLTGDIREDRKWQRFWKRTVQIPAARYKVPQGPVGRRFLTTLIREFRGVRERRWNSERPLVFQAVVLQRRKGVTAAKDIRSLLQQKMDLWDKGKIPTLLADMEAESRLRHAQGRPVPREDRLFRNFNARVLSGHLRSACRQLTDRDGGGVLQPDDTCAKTDRPVLEVLKTKHPPLRDPPTDPDSGVFEPYPETPDLPPLVITADHVEAVASHLSGAAGPGGTDAVDLRNWLLRYHGNSAALRAEMAALTTWIAASNPPWAAIRALMACRLVALDKQPGVRPVGIGEVYRRLMAKCVLRVTGDHATQACGNFNLCAGLKAGIEGAVHAMREAWEEHIGLEDDEAPPPDADEAPEAPPGQPPDRPPPSRDPFGMTCIDARNGFNELSRKAMLWTVRHRWPIGSRFAFNCYRHSAQLVLRRDGDECEILLSREGVTQGDPLSMVLYGLALVPLAERLREAVPAVSQPWYADDAAMFGPASGLAEATRLLLKFGPARGYFPEPAKSLYLGRPQDRTRAQEILGEFNFQHRDGARYIGGFVGSKESLDAWLTPKIEEWADHVRLFAKVAHRYPQTAYTGLIKSLQVEWTYLQRVVPSVSDQFGPVEDALREAFLPALFGEDSPDTTDALRDLICFPVRFAGLGVPDPVASAEQHFRNSVEATAQISASLRQGEQLDALGYGQVSVQLTRQRKKAHEKELEAALEAHMATADAQTARRMRRSKDTGSWLTTTPDTLNGTDLTAEEFRDSLRLRHGLTPKHLPKWCDGCHRSFSVGHALSCPVGGLIMQRHQTLATEWHQLCAAALTPSSVTDEPSIPNLQYGAQGAAQGTPPPALRGDVGAHGFWRSGTTAVFDIRVTDTDAAKHRNRDPAKALAKQENEKKQKYGEACREAHMHFTPLVFSVDGMEGREATAARKRLASRLAAKWNREYSQICGFVRSKLAVALVRTTSRCLRGTRDPGRRPQALDWVAGSGLRLFH